MISRSLAVSGLLTVILMAGLLRPTSAMAEAVIWPAYGPEREGLVLDGFTNTVPDIVGPVDGSAKLTIFTEGNHFPVLLPMVLDRFPVWCAETGKCDIAASDIMVVTLPQVMIVEALTKGSIRLGNAVIPLRVEGNVFPDIVMGGAGPLRRLAAAGLIEQDATVFARHQGMGLLLPKDRADQSLADFAKDGGRLVIATPNEAGARRQYVATLNTLVGETEANALLARDIGTFPGRLGIQHRDIPYALLNDLADGGIIFGHLAAFYAGAYPDKLTFVPVPDASTLRAGNRGGGYKAHRERRAGRCL